MILDPPPLDERDRAVLHVMGEARFDPAQAWMLSALPARLALLERHGLVTRLDDARPIAWGRTPKGTAALAGEDA